MKNNVTYKDIEIVYKKKETKSDIEIIFPQRSKFKIILEATTTMRNDRDDRKDIQAQGIIRYHKEHGIEVLYGIVVMDDDAYTGPNAHKEIRINNRIAKEINEERTITTEINDCAHLFLRESEAYDCIEHIKDNLHKDTLTLISECRGIIKNNKRTEREFEGMPEQLSFFDVI